PPRCWRHGRPAAGISFFLAARARTSWLRGLVLPGCAGTYFLAARARTSWPRGHVLPGCAGTAGLLRGFYVGADPLGGLLRSAWPGAWRRGVLQADGQGSGSWAGGDDDGHFDHAGSWVGGEDPAESRGMTRCQQRGHPLDSGFGAPGGPGG